MPTNRRALTGAIAVAVALGLDLTLPPANIMAQDAITEIIDASGDGAGNPLRNPWGIAADGAGNVFVAGFESDNAFRTTPLPDPDSEREPLEAMPWLLLLTDD